MFRAAFSQADITPPLGTHKIGWLKDIVGDKVADPLFARAAVFASGEERIAFLALDTLCIRGSQTAEVRRRVAEACGLPGDHLLIAATHNHAGPAVSNVGMVACDDAYVATFLDRCTRVVCEAVAALQPAVIGFGHTYEWEVAHNRRVLMRDGTAKTHGRFSDPEALCFEGPIDPEVAVLAARTPEGEPLGCLVNFSCHPTHHGGDTAFSAGFPGAMVNELKAAGWPAALYLNGACGNTHTSDPAHDGRDLSLEEAGRRLAEDARRALEGVSFASEVTLRAASRTLQLPFRATTEEQLRGTAQGAQRFIDSAIYDALMPALVEEIRARGTQPAEVQVLSVNHLDFAGVPAEYFVEHGLRIKQAAHPRRALVVGQANGMVGYVPTKEAFLHGGYETTFTGSSKLAPEAGDLLAEAAIALIGQ